MDYTDEDRREFLDALDQSSISVSDWEAQFIESTIGVKKFSERQRQSIDRMMEKYDSRL